MKLWDAIVHGVMHAFIETPLQLAALVGALVIAVLLPTILKEILKRRTPPKPIRPLLSLMIGGPLVLVAGFGVLGYLGYSNRPPEHAAPVTVTEASKPATQISTTTVTQKAPERPLPPSGLRFVSVDGNGMTYGASLREQEAIRQFRMNAQPK
jgi:hypothetical protein